MEEVKAYKTADGKVFIDIVRAEKHERLIELLNAIYSSREIDIMTDGIVFDNWDKKDFIKWQFNKLSEMKKDLLELWRE